MVNLKIQISNHPKFHNRQREVVLLSENYYSGGCSVQNYSIIEGQPRIEFGFKILYFEEIEGNKFYDQNTRELFYVCSDINRIGFINNELIYLTDDTMEGFEYFPTEKDFVIDLKYTNEFTIAGEKYSLPKIDNRNMTLEEITKLFIINLDTRNSGSIFIE